MKRILTILFVCCTALAFSSCTENNGDNYSLKLGKNSLDFDAKDAPGQRVTVTAENLEWKVAVDSGASSWLFAVKDGDEVVITVKNNISMQERSGIITVTPTGNVKPGTITVTQKGSDTPPEFDIILTPSSLTFDPEKAPAQEVTVTTEGEGLTWTAVPDDKVKSWISVEVVGDKIKVTVTDNPDTKERPGNIIVTTNESSVDKKAIRVVQKPKVLPPSLTADWDGNPIEFEYDVKDDNIMNLRINAVNVKWTSSAVDADNKVVNWITLRDVVTEAESNSFVEIKVKQNADTNPRTAYIVITPDVESVKPVRITVTQTGYKAHFSDLMGNVTIAGGLWAQRAAVTLVQRWDDTTDSCYWIVRFMGAGMTWSDNGPTVTGKGERIELAINSSAVKFNDQKEYYLPDGAYNVVDADSAGPMTLEAGTKGWSHPRYPSGAWYMSMDGDKYINQAPIVSGKMTVSRTGKVYTIVFDFVDDANNKITGKYEGEFTPAIQNTEEEQGGGDIGGGVDPGFGV